MPLLAPASRRRAATGPDGALRIGLVNNMPDAALRTTERQFGDVLEAASAGLRLNLDIFSFPEVPRSPEAQAHIDAHHAPIAALWEGEFDGLIVTGTAPSAASLEAEPSWPTLARLVEWAERHTGSTLWSCLAAHAAVRRIDGIERRPLGRKLSGIFDCERTGSHPLLGTAPARWRTPHSRYNELPEAALAARGYRILSRSQATGADIFVKRCGSLFVFLQGHPEYDAGALYREYRRDVRRFLAGESDDYPDMPAGYFSTEVAEAMGVFRDIAFARRDPELLAVFPTGPAIHAPWRHAAACFYAGWLGYLAARRRPGFDWGRWPLAHGIARPHAATYA
ncbi:MAG TPA: homoserine O-succinyltransferase [Stellaceae bacterium]|nr:homoserine O-succinyltransferase [Stellaceae bacterium]